MKIITHRGLDPALNPFPLESTQEAFENQLTRGFGLEFDVRLSKDNVPIAIHDESLERISKGSDKRLISEINSEELLSIDFSGNHLVTVSNLLKMIETGPADTVSAIHLKKSFQSKESIDVLLKILRTSDPKKYILFDTTIETARYIKRALPEIDIAASVSHSFDIKRYNAATGGTLYTVDELLANKDLFSWAWLDEWDLLDENGGQKKLLTREVFSELRENSIKIALVTPELHGTSPGLLGGETHPDAEPHESRWRDRMREIIHLEPDLVCTDYPDEAAGLIA